MENEKMYKRWSLSASEGCEVCSNPVVSDVKAACLNLRLCTQHHREWDNVVIEMQEWKDYQKAEYERLAVAWATQGGVLTVAEAITENGHCMDMSDVAQRILRPLLLKLLADMKAAYEAALPQAPDPFDTGAAKDTTGPDDNK